MRQQEILTARVYTPEGGGALPRPQLDDPRVTGASTRLLGEDDATASRDGRPHQVYERRYALFPNRPGPSPWTPSWWMPGI